MDDVLEQLYKSQLNGNFELAQRNYANLKQVVYRTIPFDGFNIRIQFNPDRMISTAAKTDEKTLKERKCFLCLENIPIGQLGLRHNIRYNIFMNPYPIFERHYTVPSATHSEQLIEGRFEDILELARCHQGYTLFYNGPESGASAPDHFHFQIVSHHVMPIETDVTNEQIKKVLFNTDCYSISTLENYLRRVIIFKSDNQQTLSRLFQQAMSAIGQFVSYKKEPKVNLFSWFDHGQWTVCLFPRTELRPWQFFATGPEQILCSLGCADIAGLIIAPRKEDFKRYDQELLKDIFKQVTIPEDVWKNICQRLLCLTKNDI